MSVIEAPVMPAEANTFALDLLRVKAVDMRKALSVITVGKHGPLSCIRVGVNARGTVEVSGGDLDVWTRVTIGSHPAPMRHIVVEAASLRAALKGAKGEVNLSVTDSSLTLGHVTMPASQWADDMPNEPSVVDGQVFTHTASNLAWVAKACTKTDTMPVFAAVFLTPADVVATNRYQLHLHESGAHAGHADGVSINAKSLATMLRGKPELVTFTTSPDAAQTAVQYVAGNLSVHGYIRNTMGSFPKYRDLIPADAPPVAHLPAAELRQAVAGIGAVLDRNRPVRMVFDADTDSVRLHSGSPEDGPYAEHILASGVTVLESFTAAYNPEFLVNLLTGFEGDVRMQSVEPYCKPSVFTGNDTDRVGLIMPVKI